MAEPAPAEPPLGRVMVVEDDAVMRMLTVQILEGAGYAVRPCGSLLEARQAIEQELPDVVTVDLQLVDGSGMELLSDMRAAESTVGIPVIMVTGTSESGFIETALTAGAQDFIRKPFEPIELLARVAAALRVKRMHDALTRLAAYDVLTDLPNRRGLLAILDLQIAHRERSGEPLALVMLDIVNFKGVNDDLGHTSGDRVLKDVAHSLRHSLRGGDVAGRLGGDEFLVILPRTGQQEAEVLIDRLKTRLSAEVALPGRLVEVRAGIAEATNERASADLVLAAAADDLHRERAKSREPS